MQTSLNVTSIDSNNKKSTKSITYVNPNATNAELKTLAQKFNAISTNEYQDAERIDRQSVEESKPQPTLTLESMEQESFLIQNQQLITERIRINYNGDSDITINVPKAKEHIPYIRKMKINAGYILDVLPGTTEGLQGLELTITSVETTTYAAKTLTVTITQE